MYYRNLGTAVCEMCSETFQKASAMQRFCPSCGEIHIREYKSQWNRKRHPDAKPHTKSNEKCVACGADFASHFKGLPYCNKHYLQMYTNGFIGAKPRQNTNTFFFAAEGVVVGTTADGNHYLFDAADYDLVSQHSWCFSKTGYLVSNINGKVTKMHRFLLNAEPGQTIDHINGDSSDNRRSNLRFCSVKDNSRNAALCKKSQTGVTGVKQTESGKYVAKIMVNRKHIHIGTFPTLEEARIARIEAERYYFGEFAPSNSRPSIEMFKCGVSE